MTIDKGEIRTSFRLAKDKHNQISVKPILFRSEMVRAILDGRKTVTRRVVKPRYGGSLEVYKDLAGVPRLCERCGTLNRGLRPPHEIGDILWVQETWAYGCTFATERKLFYRADGDSDDVYRWRPSIHMPREAARIWLRVTDVRVERLQEITMRDIRREGSVPSCAMCSFNEVKSVHGIKCRKAIERSADCALENQFPDCGFRGFWDSTIKRADLDRYGWDANPWVWVVSFERCEKPEEA